MLRIFISEVILKDTFNIRLNIARAAAIGIGLAKQFGIHLRRRHSCQEIDVLLGDVPETRNEGSTA